MKNKHALFLYLIVLISIFQFQSCSFLEGKKEYITYTIPQGKHGSNFRPSLFTKQQLRFLAKFDNTATYATIDPLNQLDANKLYGFSDCGDGHQKNSARFGWRFINNRIEIFAYCYVNSIRNSQYISSVELNQEYEYKINISDNHYIFTLNGVSLIMERGCSKGGSKYHLFPFFGGDETAPHDIHIRIKEL
jgi:hypothetical protein